MLKKEEIVFEVRDYRDKDSIVFYKTHYIKENGKPTQKYLRYYFIGEATMKQIIHILNIYENDVIDVKRLDGKNGRHLSATVFSRKCCIFICSAGQIDVVIPSKTYTYRFKTCKQGLKIARMIRDKYLK